MRFIALAIFLTGDLLRECAFNSRTSAFDHDRRLVRLPCFFAITYLLFIVFRDWAIKSPDSAGAEVSPFRGERRRLHNGSDLRCPL